MTREFEIDDVEKVGQIDDVVIEDGMAVGHDIGKEHDIDLSDGRYFFSPTYRTRAHESFCIEVYRLKEDAEPAHTY